MDNVADRGGVLCESVRTSGRLTRTPRLLLIEVARAFARHDVKDAFISGDVAAAIHGSIAQTDTVELVVSQRDLNSVVIALRELEFAKLTRPGLVTTRDFERVDSRAFRVEFASPRFQGTLTLAASAVLVPEVDPYYFANDVFEGTMWDAAQSVFEIGDVPIRVITRAGLLIADDTSLQRLDRLSRVGDNEYKRDAIAVNPRLADDSYVGATINRITERREEMLAIDHTLTVLPQRTPPLSRDL